MAVCCIRPRRSQASMEGEKGNHGNSRGGTVITLRRSLRGRPPADDLPRTDEQQGVDGSIIITEKVRTELDTYLDEPLVCRTADFDIINWWKVGGAKYPTLQKIARDILPIPVTSVASESVFSTSERLLSAHRSRLTPSIAEAFMCMQAWSPADMLGDINFALQAIQCILEDQEEVMDENESIITEV